MLVAGEGDGVLFCKTFDMKEEVLRNLKESSYSICCLSGLHVSLPSCLRLWHSLLPLRLFLGGVRPDALSLPGSKELGPPHHLLAIALNHVRKRENKNHYSHYISTLFSRAPVGLKYVFLLNRRQIFPSLEKQTVEGFAPSHVIYPSTAFGPTWTLTYLNVSLDKVLLFFLAFGSSTVAAFKLLFPSLLVTYFKWFCGAVWRLFTCRASHNIPEGKYWKSKWKLW